MLDMAMLLRKLKMAAVSARLCRVESMKATHCRW
jgi:hypothetical protein